MATEAWRAGLHDARRRAEDRIGEHLANVSGVAPAFTDAVLRHIANRRVPGDNKLLYDNPHPLLDPVRECLKTLNSLSEWDSVEIGPDIDDATILAEIAEEAARLPPAPSHPDDDDENAGGPSYDLPCGVVGFDEASAQQPFGSLVPGLFDRASLAVLFGPPNCAKTFWALDLALCLGSGTPHRGRALPRSAVLFCAMEGAAGITSRVEAWKIARPEIASAAIAISPHHFDLSDPDDARKLLDHAIECQRGLRLPIGLIVCDTLPRSLGGKNENASEVMGQVVASAGLLQKELGATVLLLHHPGHAEPNRMRGHSSLSGAADTVLQVSADELGNRAVIVRKQREGEIGERLAFRLAPSGASAVVQHDAVAPPRPRAPAADHMALLVEASAIAWASGNPLCLTGSRGVFERMNELPAPLHQLTRVEIRRLGNDAVKAGHLERTPNGVLTVPGVSSTDSIH